MWVCKNSNIAASFHTTLPQPIGVQVQSWSEPLSIPAYYGPSACMAPMVFFNCSGAQTGAKGSECQKSCQSVDSECVSGPVNLMLMLHLSGTQRSDYVIAKRLGGDSTRSLGGELTTAMGGVSCFLFGFYRRKLICVDEGDFNTCISTPVIMSTQCWFESFTDTCFLTV